MRGLLCPLSYSIFDPVASSLSQYLAMGLNNIFIKTFSDYDPCIIIH